MNFYSALARYYEEIFPCSDESCDFLYDFLAGGKKGLDSGCGTGELVRRLRQKGTDFRGFDLDEEMVRLARQTFKETKKGDPAQGGDVFRKGDLRRIEEIFPELEFDLITCLGNTIAHLPAKGIRSFLRGASAILRDGGTLLIQTLNYPNLLEGRSFLQEIKTAHCLFKRQYKKTKQEGVLSFETELSASGELHSYAYSTYHYPVLPDQFPLLLKEAGFGEVALYGNWNRGVLTDRQLPLYVEGTKAF